MHFILLHFMSRASVSLIHNHIINKVRLYRLELDISQIDLSKLINPDTESNFVGVVESDKTPAVYNDDHLNKIAKAFTRIACELQGELDSIPGNTVKIKTEYTIFDFYPPAPLPEGKQIKAIDQIPKELKATGTLNLLLETDDPFIRQWHSVREITDYCNHLTNKNWKGSDFTAILDRAERKGKMIKSEEQGIRYRKA